MIFVYTFLICTNIVLIAEAIHKNPPTKSTTESELQTEVVRFLRGAADRSGGRKERAVKDAAKQRNACSSTSLPRVMYSDDDSDD